MCKSGFVLKELITSNVWCPMCLDVAAICKTYLFSFFTFKNGLPQDCAIFCRLVLIEERLRNTELEYLSFYT